MTSLKKTIKAEPFTVGEDARLMKLVMMHVDVVECRVTDHKNNL